MPNYRRALVAGGCWFFTVNLLERSQTLLVDHIDVLRRAFDKTRADYPFEIEAIVILPDHLHAIWSLPPDDADFSTRWRLIRTRFAKALPKRERRSAVRERRGERGIWQRRYWENTLRDEDDFARHTDYIHYNPVKHGYVRRVRDWHHSSFRRMVRLGVYPPDWAGDAVDVTSGFGER